jgi:hypothetical protein
LNRTRCNVLALSWFLVYLFVFLYL